MSVFSAGYAKVDITPPEGCLINGYFIKRYVKGALDALELCCLALSLDGKKVVLCSLDNLGIPESLLTPMRRRAADFAGLEVGQLYVACTHSHTAGAIRKGETEEKNIAYLEQVTLALCEGVKAALADLSPCRMAYGVGKAPNSAFGRRYRMKDGSVRTNPGVGNPEVAESLNPADERVNVLRFDREGDSLLLVNFGNHPDTVGGELVSADWPGFARRETRRALPDTKVIFFNGAQGDVNHVKVFPEEGDLNDMENDFDDVYRGYGHARYLGRVIAGSVLQVYDKMRYRTVERLVMEERWVKVPSNMPTPEELVQAREIAAMHEAGRDSELPYKGMMLTTVVASSLRMLRLEHGPEFFNLPITSLAIGPVAMIGLPGEPFTGIGVALKETEGWELVLPTCATNGYEGYFPMAESYEGGYEAGTSSYRAGVAELLIEEGKALLQEIAEK